MLVCKATQRGSSIEFFHDHYMMKTKKKGQKVTFCCNQIRVFVSQSIVGHNIGANIIKWHYYLSYLHIHVIFEIQNMIIEFKIIPNTYSTTSHFVKDVLLVNKIKSHFFQNSNF